MFFYQGLSCPHCDTPFTEQDDIVACPVCGAPHHRDCWKEHGGCACAESHGTDEQWSRETASRQAEKTEPVQETVTDDEPDEAQEAAFSEDAVNGSPFGVPPSAAFNEYAPFRSHRPPCGGVSPDAVLCGETAADLCEVVATNTEYYMPRFERMASSPLRPSWNWAAFIAPGCWLLYRKQYAAGAAVLLFRVVSDVFINLLMISFFSSAIEQSTLAEMYTEIERILQTMEHPELLLLGTMMIWCIWLVLGSVHLLTGLYGNRLYMMHCRRCIRKARSFYPEGYRARLPVVGGTSLALALVGFMCYQLLPGMIIMLL